VFADFFKIITRDFDKVLAIYQTTIGQRSFAFYDIPTTWNSLPSALRNNILALNTFVRAAEKLSFLTVMYSIRYCCGQWRLKRYGGYGGRHTDMKFGMAATYQSAKFEQLIFRKIIKIVATRCQI